MIKFTQGSITNLEGVTKDIVVKSELPLKARELFIGVGLVVLGISYLTKQSFIYGAMSMGEAEFHTMQTLGIIKD